MHPLNKKIKPYTSKLKKTDEDYEIISDYEWLMSAYYTNDDILDPRAPLTGEHKLYMPAENIRTAIAEGGRANKKGQDIIKYVTIAQDGTFNVLGNPSFETMMRDFKYRDVRPVNVQRNKVTRTRARFDSWEVTFALHFDEGKINIQTIVDAIEHAGKYIGLCDFRQQYGKFVSIINEIE
jgi:hypothetical protein